MSALGPDLSSVLPAGSGVALADLDGGRLDALRRAPAGEARRAAATELQVVFLAQLLSALRRTVPENDFLPRSPERNVYDGMFDRSVAETMARSDPLGLVKALGGADPALKKSAPPADTAVGDPRAVKP